MVIRLISDTHIEFATNVIIPSPSDVLICAGDIGVMAHYDKMSIYFEQLRKTTKHLIYILGNHEFYHNDYDLVLKTAERLGQTHDIHVMDIELGTDNLTIDGVTFWGSTLWVDLNGSPIVFNEIDSKFADCVIIGKQNRHFCAGDMHNINIKTRKQINWDADVIITHHAPMHIPHPKFPFTELSHGFYNNGLEQQIADSNVKYWLFGHTHHSCDFLCGNTRIVSNQVGYPNEGLKYDHSLVLSI